MKRTKKQCQAVAKDLLRCTLRGTRRFEWDGFILWLCGHHYEEALDTRERMRRAAEMAAADKAYIERKRLN